ncbi:MAG TPA: FAD-dependent oxidoreductase, partial [Candidatus Dormibacteraeota bacterium]|nr:FAD-dependent oxidoreductase [Candidatus Dormibacteraeota bacterium]
MTPSVAIRHDLVLVGGGHTHIQVLRAWAMDPAPGVRVTVVVDRPVAVYSGMVPGFVAGQYRQDELEIDVRPLAMRAGARFIVAAATGLDPSQRRVILEGRPPLAYDTISFDVGSTIAGLDRPGIAEHAIPTRPIGAFVRSADAIIERARGRPGFRLVVVGAGAGGVELVFAFRARFEREGIGGASVALLEAGPTVLPGYPAAAVRAIERNARARGIEIRCGVLVARASADHVELESGEIIPADALVWVTGAASLPIFDGAGLERDPAGFVRVRPTLQAVGHDEIFAVGDCASLLTDPHLPKAGVYAVRQGPTLIANLRARVMGGSMRRYRPQRDFLSLLNLGDGRALASKWGTALEGQWAFTLKDWIDRR